MNFRDELREDMFMKLPRKQFIGYQQPAPTRPRTEEHQIKWIRACKGGPQAQLNFKCAVRLTAVLCVNFK